MTEKWDITVKVNLTLEYAEKGQRPSDVKADAHSLLDGESFAMSGVAAFVVEVTGGKAGFIE